MEPLVVRVTFAPGATATALAFILGGVLLGTLSGLVPGLHVNNLALMLAAVAPMIPGPPHLVGAAMLAAGTVHTFLDVVPALALGVPDPAMAPMALPGHKLVLAGRGREALRLSALGSGLAVALAIPLAIPVTLAMVVVYPYLMAHVNLVLLGVAGFLVVTEHSPRGKVGAVVCLLASTILGMATLDQHPDGLLPADDVLVPLFAGLFGAPLLIDAIDGAGVPEQDDAAVASTPRSITATAATGTLAGAAVGYLPAVSSAIASLVALLAAPDDGPRGFVVATSGANTANGIFALFALVTFGTPRTGVLVALERAEVPLNLPLFLSTVAIAAAIGAVLVPLLGDRYLRIVGSADYTKLSLAILGLLIVLSFAFAGWLGLATFGIATFIGMIPPHFGTRRVTLMGVLIGPIIVGTW